MEGMSGHPVLQVCTLPTAKGLCNPWRPDGCAHFCRPGPSSYLCSCARGHQLGPDRKACEPHGEWWAQQNGTLGTPECGLLTP